jgi:MFS family permease
MIARTDERRLLMAGTVVCALGLCLAALATTSALAYAGLVVMGLGGSVLAPTAFSAIGRLTPEPLRAHVLARATALGYMGYFFGPPVLGLLSDAFTLRVAFLVVALVVTAVIGLYPLMLRAADGQDHRQPSGPAGRDSGGM